MALHFSTLHVACRFSQPLPAFYEGTADLSSGPLATHFTLRLPIHLPRLLGAFTSLGCILMGSTVFEPVRNEDPHPVTRALETQRGKGIAESRVSQEGQVHRSAQVHYRHRHTDRLRLMDQEQVHGSSTVGGLYNLM